MNARVLEVGLCLAAGAAFVTTALHRVEPDELAQLPAAAGRAFDAPAALADSMDVPVATPMPTGAGTRDDPLRLDFAALAFPDYDPPELRGADAGPLALERFPAAISTADGRFVRLEGYMLAVDFSDGRVTSFVLSRFPPGCCFGATPIFDEWLDVTPADTGVEQRSAYAPLEVVGVLEAGEALDAAGRVESLYRLRAAEVRELR